MLDVKEKEEEEEEEEVVFLRAEIYRERRAGARELEEEKLGHVEKSSCNDPTQGPADSLHVCLSSLSLSVFISFTLWSHLSLLSDIQSSCFAFSSTFSLFLLPLLRLPSLHLYIFSSFSKPASSPSYFLQDQRSLVQ